MVNIDVLRAQALGKCSGDLAFETQADESLLSIPFVVFSTPVSVAAHYEICEDGKVEITGSVRFRLKGLCSRCMKETEQEISGELEALFLPERENGEDYAYYGGKIKLDEAVRDAVMFALPNSLLCGQNCEIPAFH